MKKKIVASIAVILLAVVSFAEKTIDQQVADLEKKLQRVEGKEKIEILNELAFTISGNSPKKSMEYANQALVLSQKYKDPGGEAAALRYIGEGYRKIGDSEKAMEYAEKSLKICEKSGDKKGLASSLRNIGIVYSISGNHDKALELFKKSLKIGKEIGDKKSVADSLHFIGIIHMIVGNFDKALKFHLRSLDLREELGNKRAIATSLTNIGSTYRSLKEYGKDLEFFQRALKIQREIGDKKGIASCLNNIGTIYGEQDNYDMALEYFLESLKMKEEMGNKRDIATSLNNIGMIYKKMTNYDKALEYFRKSLNIREEIGDKLGILSNANNMGAIYTELGKYDDAFFYLSKGLSITKEVKSKEEIVYNYENFSAFYEAKGDYKKALEYYKRAAEVKATLLNEKISKQIAEMQTRYETLKKEKKIEILTKNNELLNKNSEIQKLRLDREKITRNAFIIGFILVSIILVLLFRKFLYLFSFWKKQKYIGRFRLVEEIGTGGMGAVYKAHNIRDKTDTAAVKVLKPELFKDETVRKRFKQEAAIIDKLDHPHIIKIIERGEYKEKLFIAMELLHGKTLDVKIDEQGQLDFKECFHIMSQVSDALVLIHGKDIVHRDLKPSNIMLIERNGDPNFVKLLDFGIAKMKFQTSITRTGILVGSINYMSPEQLANSELSSASDVYSLGVTFYQMTTGRIVFPGETANEITRQVLDAAPIEPHRYRPDIPGELDDLIMKMLEKNKESRPVIKEVFETLQMIQAKYK